MPRMGVQGGVPVKAPRGTATFKAALKMLRSAPVEAAEEKGGMGDWKEWRGIQGREAPGGGGEHRSGAAKTSGKARPLRRIVSAGWQGQKS